MMHPRDTFELHLDLIERVLRSIASRNALGVDEAEEFASWARLKLLEDDCRILGAFRGRSKLSTYLHVVLQNLFRDFRIRRWGKWRPSAAAKRLGTAAVQLESMISRDAMSSEEAIRRLVTSSETDLSATELERLCGLLPARIRRRRVSDVVLDDVPAAGATDDGIAADESSRDLDRAASALNDALRKLGSEDRLVLRLRFEEGMRIADIAGALGIRPRKMYSRMTALLLTLRSKLEERGIRREQLDGLLGWSGFSLDLDLEGPENRPSSPSKPMTVHLPSEPRP